MESEIGSSITQLLRSDLRRDYTIPEVMSALSIRNREKVVTAIARLEERGTIEVARVKGRAKYYRLKVGH